MLDEESGTEPRVLSASIADPYLLLIRDDSSCFILVAKPDSDMEYELEELEKTDVTLNTTKWVTGCLYTDHNGVFSDGSAGKSGKPGQGDNILMFLLCAEGALHVRTSCACLRALADEYRSIVYPICQGPSMWPRMCRAYPRASRLAMLLGKGQSRKK